MKKLLALVLALVMTLSLCVTSNAAYADAADIDYTEAVDVMSAIGVLEGADGKFNPTGTLTREQGAKIISYMLMGGKTAGDALAASKAPFTDVAADRWSAGAIAYCAYAGILAGDGTGKFNPEAPLTGYAFAKMLLTALGYDAAREGLKGGDWELNTIKLVNRVDLANGLSGMLFSNTITREQAAKLSYNTLMATMVEYSGALTADAQGNLTASRQYVANTAYTFATNGTGGLCSGNVSEGGAALGTVVVNLNNGDMQFIENYFPNMKLVIGTNDFGETTHSWYKGSTRTDYIKTAAKTAVAEEVDDAIVTYTAKTKEAVVKADLDGYTEDIRKANMIVDGLAEAGTGTDASAVVTAVTGANGIEDITANGRVVKVYDTNKDMVIDKIVVINAELAKVTAVSDKDKTVTYTLIAAGGALSATGTAYTSVTGYGTVAKNDYVMINRASSTTDSAASDVTPSVYKATDTSTTDPCVLAVTPATKVTGAISKTSKTGANVTDLTIDGTTYKASAYARTAVTTAGVSSTSYDTYLDAFGYAVDTTATSVKKDLAYIVNATGTVGHSIDGDSVTVTVRAVLEDGTVGSYKLATTKLSAANVATGGAYAAGGTYGATASTHSVGLAANTGAVNATTQTFEANDIVIKNTNIRVYKTGEAALNVDANLYTATTGALADLDAVYAYKLNDAGDTMTLTALAEASGAMTADTTYVLETTGINTDDKDGDTTPDGTAKTNTSYTRNTATALVNADTDFVVYNTDSKKATVYHGNNNMPTGTNLPTAYVVLIASGTTTGKTQTIFASVGASLAPTASAQIVYVDYSETGVEYVDSKAVTTYKAYKADGEVLWLKDASSTVFAPGNEDGLYSYDGDTLVALIANNTTVTVASPAAPGAYKATTSVSDNMLLAGTYYYITDNTKTVYLDPDNNNSVVDGKNVFVVVDVDSNGLTANLAAIYVLN